MKPLPGALALLLSFLVGCSTAVRQADTPEVNVPQTNVPATRSVAPRVASTYIYNPPLAPSVGLPLLNKNYNDNSTACSGNQPLFRCSGVFLRTVDNGNFDPWTASASANALGSSSFTWLRHDLSTKTLYHRAGYIRMNPDDINKYYYDGQANWSGVNCLYPFDAYTVRKPRNYNGCDFERAPGAPGTPNPAHYIVWGSCDNKLGYTTAAQWNAHYQSNGQTEYSQCSWSSGKASNWMAMIASHESFPAKTSWNEILVPTVGVIEDVLVMAFFYDANKPGARDDARAFQSKLASKKARRVPIYSINFNAAPSSRFGYSASDQIVYP